MAAPRLMAHSRRMKSLGMLLLMVLLSRSVLAADDFWQQLTPEERKAAGYEQLSPGQRALLDQFAQRFAEARVRPAIVVAKEKAREEGRAEAQAANLEKKKANLGLAPREDDETEVVRTRISGEFRGWSGRTQFKLANNQVWEQEKGENRFFPVMVDPEVEIRPSRLGGWKLTLVKEGLWIRVKRVR